MEKVEDSRTFKFPVSEVETLSFWSQNDCFREQNRRQEGNEEYVFYDGPPFATGLPHYGHILAGTIKDVVTRYAATNGYHVTRRFGWDCHGLPVEYEIDQKLQVKSSDDVKRMGMDVYNEECRSIVMRYSGEWRTTIERLGRWIDFDNDYKTLDTPFMESVWWVFKQLHAKELVYRGFKVMPYSTACHTPLSNFESGLNYKDVNDPAVVVSFPVFLPDGSDGIDGASAYAGIDVAKSRAANASIPAIKNGVIPAGARLCAWTTTPWTLPSNVALCVNPAFTYVAIQSNKSGDVFIVAEARVAELPGYSDGKKKKKGAPDTPPTYTVLHKFPGSDLKGLHYYPLFGTFSKCFTDPLQAYRVCVDGYVTDDSGTGVVHQAPAFGADDNRVCLAHGIIVKGGFIPDPIDDDGRFDEQVSSIGITGIHVKEADKKIVETLKEMKRLVSNNSLVHSYPFCWRSDTPLIYKAVPSWFVKVESIKDRIVANNEKTYWVPSFVKEKRFKDWLVNANDWAVSRNRYWGTPIPIWANDDYSEMEVFGSIAELEERAGLPKGSVTDIHRHKIDHIEVPSRKPGGKPLRRIDEVFDCWFESGSMPYAYIHYPFENKERFEANFPANFIAEGLDQTRGWFYTLMVLSTALFDKPAFQNLVCNGLVLAADGKKMSKRLKNYPDPNLVIDSYGADALRLYLINSPVVRAEPLRFKEEGVNGVVRDVFLPWYNAYRFLQQQVERYEMAEGKAFRLTHGSLMELAQSCDNTVDLWVIASASSLVQFIRNEMEHYRLYTVVPRLVGFLESLTNVYLRLNRNRLKGMQEGATDGDCFRALSVLHEVLFLSCRAMSSFTPYIVEMMYQNLRRVMPGSPLESIHYVQFPKADEVIDVATFKVKGGAIDMRTIETSVDRMINILELARQIRNDKGKPVKVPLRRMVICHPDADLIRDLTKVLDIYIKEEMNVEEVVGVSDLGAVAKTKCDPEFSRLGSRAGKRMKEVTTAIRGFGPSEIATLKAGGEVALCGGDLTITVDDVAIKTEYDVAAVAKQHSLAGEYDAKVNDGMLVALDLEQDIKLRSKQAAREIISRAMKLRKSTGLDMGDRADVFVACTANPGEPAWLKEALVQEEATFMEKLKCGVASATLRSSSAVVIGSDEELAVGGEGDAGVNVVVSLAVPTPVASTKCAACSVDAANAYLGMRSRSTLRAECDANGCASFVLDGKKVTLKPGVDFFFSAYDAMKNM